MERWRIWCTAAQYDWLCSDEGLGAVLALGRCANQVRCFAETLDAARPAKNATEIRQQVGALFGIISTVYEARKLVVQRIGQHFPIRSHKGYARLRKLWDDPRTEEFIQKHADELRHHAVNHFDPHAMAAAMARYRVTDPVTFAIGQGETSRDQHFTLSDAVAMAAFVGPVSTAAELFDKRKQLVHEVNRIAHDFLLASDEFMAAVLAEYGFNIESLTEEQSSVESKPSGDYSADGTPES